MRDNPGSGRASSKHGVPYAGVLVGATVNLPDGYYCGAELDAIAYFQLSSRRNLVILTDGPSVKSDSPPFDTIPTEPVISVATSRPFALRLDLVLIGKRW